MVSTYFNASGEKKCIQYISTPHGGHRKVVFYSETIGPGSAGGASAGVSDGGGTPCG